MNNPELIKPSMNRPPEIEVRLTGISDYIYIDDKGEEVKMSENYYLTLDDIKNIYRTTLIAEEVKSKNYSRLLYYPQYREFPTETGASNQEPLATTIISETINEAGVKEWKTIGHIWGVDATKLKELGFKMWNKDDYKSARSPGSNRIDILELTDETIYELNSWLTDNKLKPILLQELG